MAIYLNTTREPDAHSLILGPRLRREVELRIRECYLGLTLLPRRHPLAVTRQFLE
jgi:hypothetical protein